MAQCISGLLLAYISHYSHDCCTRMKQTLHSTQWTKILLLKVLLEFLREVISKYVGVGVFLPYIILDHLYNVHK